MNRRRSPLRSQLRGQKQPIHRCGECRHAYGQRRPSQATGEMTMCLCPHVDNASHYILTCRHSCPKFQPK